MAALRALVGKGMLPEDILDSHAARSRMSPGGGTALHAAAYMSNAHIALAKALVGHLGAGPHLQRWRRLGLFHPSQVLLLLSLFLSLSVCFPLFFFRKCIQNFLFVLVLLSHQPSPLLSPPKRPYNVYYQKIRVSVTLSFLFLASSTNFGGPN